MGRTRATDPVAYFSGGRGRIALGSGEASWAGQGRGVRLLFPYGRLGGVAPLVRAAGAVVLRTR
jgi:hypothetical protein